MAKYFIIIAALLTFSACASDPKEDATAGTNASPNAERTVTDSTPAVTDSNTTASNPFTTVMDIMMKDLHGLALTGDADQDFALMMKRHHQAAVELCNLEITKGSNQELIKMARASMDQARKDINELTDFIGKHKPAGSSDFAKNAMDAMMKVKTGESSATGTIDEEFKEALMAHHNQGLAIAEAYVPHAKEDKPKKLAQKILKDNNTDLKKLQGLDQIKK